MRLLLLLLIAIKENALLHEMIYMILVAGNFLNTVSVTNTLCLDKVKHGINFHSTLLRH